MYAPQTYLVALILMLISMVCWGSWPNFLKKLPGWRLEYFYIDYTLGFLITAVLFGLTLGPGDGLGFLEVVSHAGAREATFAIIGGFIWNIGKSPSRLRRRSRCGSPDSGPMSFVARPGCRR